MFLFEFRLLLSFWWFNFWFYDTDRNLLFSEHPSFLSTNDLYQLITFWSSRECSLFEMLSGITPEPLLLLSKRLASSKYLEKEERKHCWQFIIEVKLFRRFSHYDWSRSIPLLSLHYFLLRWGQPPLIIF